MIRKRRVFLKTADFFALLGAASSAAAAVQGGRAPNAVDLNTLGIAPAQFKAIGRWNK